MAGLRTRSPTLEDGASVGTVWEYLTGGSDDRSAVVAPRGRVAHGRRLRDAGPGPARDVARALDAVGRDRGRARLGGSGVGRERVAVPRCWASGGFFAPPLSARGPARDRRRRDLARPLRPPRHADDPGARGPCASVRRSAWRRGAPRVVGRRARVESSNSTGGTASRSTASDLSARPRVTSQDAKPDRPRPDAVVRMGDHRIRAARVLQRRHRALARLPRGRPSGLGPFDMTFVESGAYNDAWADVHLGSRAGRSRFTGWCAAT